MTRRFAAASAAAASLALAACSPAYAPTPVPSPGSAALQPPAPAKACGDATKSYDPLPAGPPPAGSTMARIADRGRLVVGISSDALPLGYRNALNGDLEGFEVDLARAMGHALGKDTPVELRVIPLDGLTRTLNDGDIDMAIRQVGMTCNSWDTMRFSAPYATVGIRALAHEGVIPTKESLAKHTVCATAGSQAAQVAADGRAKVVTALDDTGCMVLFQRGDVDAVVGTEPVMAGLARQDPYAKVSGADLGSSNLAVAVRGDRPDLAVWANQVLAQYATSGWGESWNRWMRPYVGDATPPKPQYGRPRR